MKHWTRHTRNFAHWSVWGLATLAMGYSIQALLTAVTIFFDPFAGAATVGVLDGITFTPKTAVFDSHGDGIEYDASLFPAEGVMEVVLRLNEPPRAEHPGGFYPFSTILDSAGVDIRTQGDIFLFVSDTGIVNFTLSDGPIDPRLQVQVTSTTSILDGRYHAVAVCYGSGGIRLFIDRVLQASNPYSGARAVSRPVALGDFTDRLFSDAAYRLSFIGEVDAIRTSDQCDPSLVPPSQYQFTGFGEPITMGVTNIAQAGRVIPVTWRLTDLANEPVADPASVAGVFSFETGCDSGAIFGDPVEEYAAGSSGLQYLGDGYWQFNWKTAKAYANTCRRMFVKLSDGQMSDQVKFQFR